MPGNNGAITEMNIFINKIEPVKNPEPTCGLAHRIKVKEFGINDPAYGHYCFDGRICEYEKTVDGVKYCTCKGGKESDG